MEFTILEKLIVKYLRLLVKFKFSGLFYFIVAETWNLISSAKLKNLGSFKSFLIKYSKK